MRRQPCRPTEDAPTTRRLFLILICFCSLPVLASQLQPQKRSPLLGPPKPPGKDDSKLRLPYGQPVSDDAVRRLWPKESFPHLHRVPPDVIPIGSGIGRIDPKLFDPDHPQVPYLLALAQFFKVYGRKEENAITQALDIVGGSLGQEYISKWNLGDARREALFRKGGVMESYRPLVNELAAYHKVPEHHAVNFSMSFLEETADEWLVAGGAATHNTRRLRDQPPLGMLRETIVRKRVRGVPKVSEESPLDDPGWDDVGWRQERISQMQAKLLMAQRAAFARGAASKAQADVEEISEKLHTLQRQEQDSKLEASATEAAKETDEQKRKAFEQELEKANARVEALKVRREIAAAKGEASLRFKSHGPRIPSSSVDDLISDLMGSFGLRDPTSSPFSAFGGEESEQTGNADNATKGQSMDLYKRNKDSAKHWKNGGEGTGQQKKYTHVNFTLANSLRFLRQARPAGLGIPDRKTTIVLGFNVSQPRCNSGEFLAEEGFACHGESRPNSAGVKPEAQNDQPSLYFYDRLSFEPDPREEAGWKPQAPDGLPGVPLKMAEPFSSTSKAEWWFSAPSGKFLQWHFPTNREATISLKARLMPLSDTRCSSGKAEPYSVEVKPSMQNEMQAESETAATLFGTYPPDPELDGNFNSADAVHGSEVLENKASWGLSGQLLRVDNYAVTNRKKGTYTTACFKRLRVRVSYDSSQTCDPYVAPSMEALSTSGAAIFLQVTVGPFKPSEQHLGTGPFLTVVDSCPVVHAAAVAAAHRVLEGKRLSSRLCRVLSGMVTDQHAVTLGSLLPNLCPEIEKQAADRGIERLESAKIEEEAWKLAAAKTKKNKEQPVKDLNLNANLEEHKKRANVLKQLADQLEDSSAAMPPEDGELPPEHDPCSGLPGEPPDDTGRAARERNNRAKRRGARRAPTKRAGISSGWPQGNAASEALVAQKKIMDARQKQIMALKAQLGVGLGQAAAAFAKLVITLIMYLPPTIMKMIRAIIAMIIGIILTFWMGIMAAPWAFDSRMPFLCRLSIVEGKDFCNKQNDGKLVSCGPGSPGAATVCNVQCLIVFVPPIMIVMMLPPPFGLGPMPPFVNPGCWGAQALGCQREAGDAQVMRMITAFIDAIMELVMAIINIVMGIIRGVILLIMSIFAANKARVPLHMRPAPGISFAQAEEKFNAASVNAAHAAVEAAAAEKALTDFQTGVAEKSGSEWTQCNANRNAARAANKLGASKDALNEAKNREGLANGGRMPDDAPDSYNDMTALGAAASMQYSCPKFDLFGCGCTDLPGYETLSGGDCSTLKGMFKSRRRLDMRKAHCFNILEKAGILPMVIWMQIKFLMLPLPPFKLPCLTILGMKIGPGCPPGAGGGGKPKGPALPAFPLPPKPEPPPPPLPPPKLPDPNKDPAVVAARGAADAAKKLKRQAKKNNDNEIANSGQDKLGFDVSKYAPAHGSEKGGNGAGGAADEGSDAGGTGTGFDMSLQSHFQTFSSCHDNCDPFCSTRANQAASSSDIISALKYCNCGCCSDGTGNVCWSCTSAPVGLQKEETCFTETAWHMPGYDQTLNQ